MRRLFYKTVPVIRTRLQNDLNPKEQAALALFRVGAQQEIVQDYEEVPTTFKLFVDRLTRRRKK